MNPVTLPPGRAKTGKAQREHNISALPCSPYDPEGASAISLCSIRWCSMSSGRMVDDD